jgi:hypothetical protein
MATNELNFESIDRPYNAFLERNVSEDVILGANGISSEASVGATSADMGDGSATASGGSQNSVTSSEVIKNGSQLSDLFLSNVMQSTTYLPRIRGFLIDAQRGFIECMELYVGSGGIIGGSLDIPNKTAANSWHVDNSGNMWLGAALFADATFRVTNTGIVRVGAGPSIFIDGVAQRIRTSTYASGLQGWTLESDGSMEVNNITARGEFHSQILAFDEVHGSAGTQVWVKSGGKLKNDVTTLTTPSSFDIDIEDPDTGHPTLAPPALVGAIFSVGDILRIKDGSGNDNWMTVSSRSDQTTFWRYTCTKNSGTNGTFRAGAAVLDYGASGQGVIKATVDELNAPFIDIFTHTGSPWSAFTEKVRLGNLAGLTDPVTGTALSGYGLWTDNVYLTGGLKATTVEVDTDGYIRSGGVTGYADGNGFWMGDVAGVKKFSIGLASDPDQLLTYDGATLTVKGQTFDNQVWFGNGQDGKVSYSTDQAFTTDM